MATDAAEADQLASVSQVVAQKFNDLTAKHKITVADRNKFRADFEAVSSDDAVAKLTEARDRAATSGAEWEAKFQALATSNKNESIGRLLTKALFTDSEGNAISLPAKKAAAATELLLGKGVPEGVTLADDGKSLVGHLSVLKTFREQWGDVLLTHDGTQAGSDTKTGGPNGGPAPGSGAKPQARPNTKKDASTIAREEGAAMASAYMDSNLDPFRRIVSATT